MQNENNHFKVLCYKQCFLKTCRMKTILEDHENNPFEDRFTSFLISAKFYPSHNHWPLKPEFVVLSPASVMYSRVAQLKGPVPITQRSMGRNHLLQ